MLHPQVRNYLRTNSSNMAENLESQFGEENVFMKKYLALKNKCEHLQQGNEKVINRLQHVKKLIRRYNREKKFLQARLDGYKDNYREAQVPVMWEEDQMYNLLRPQTVPLAAEKIPEQQTPPKPKPLKKIKSLLKSPDQTLSNQLAAGGSHDLVSSPVATGSSQQDVYSMSLGSYDTPRRPTNAFLMFCDQYRQSVKNEYLREKNAIIPQQELTRRLALKWSSLSHEDKKIYQDMFEIQRRQHEEETSRSLISQKAVNTMYLESDAAVSSLLAGQDLT
ncbi:uncharacterized protein LOC123523013 [Mercenaria mercenaria]|uniref:uncharacterized protein LOC123523013 n=1 Tax=Mercenaria mercenaria TaxID=6596 RepID=UPI00234EAE42|nr:uncharacterized protein LOC123523013 [Mercenaria mercenaria]